jgi:polyisoprenyl-phosphate glycosyltransferase
MAKADVFVSVVAICRDAAGSIPGFVDELTAILDAEYTNFEIILLDNGSVDETGNVVRALLKEARCVRYLQLSRPLADETALTAGLDAAIGDFVVTMTPDYDPPGEIPAMVELCRAGGEVVVGVEDPPPVHDFLYRTLRRIFLRLTRALVRFEPVTGLTSFRCLSRAAVNALTRVRARRRFFSVVVADIGLRPVKHKFKPVVSSGNERRPSVVKAVRMGLSVLVHYSVAPLRLVSLLGLFGSLFSLAYSFYVVAVYLLKQDVMAGWTTLSLQVSGLFFLVFVMLTLIGEYLGRLMEEMVDRPLYHLREEHSSAVMLTDLARRNVINVSTDHPDQPGAAAG